VNEKTQFKSLDLRIDVQKKVTVKKQAVKKLQHSITKRDTRSTIKTRNNKNTPNQITDAPINDQITLNANFSTPLA
jgi:long-subunit fatty acid transport protein